MKLFTAAVATILVFNSMLTSMLKPPVIHTPTPQQVYYQLSQEEQDKLDVEFKALVAGISAKEFKMLSAVCEAESDRNKNKESIENRTLIALVILNRVDSKKFPNTITKVLKQSGQFAVVTSGAYKRVGRTKLSDRAVIEATRRKREEKVPNILYFNCRGFFRGHKRYKKVGDNYFSY